MSVFLIYDWNNHHPNYMAGHSGVGGISHRCPAARQRGTRRCGCCRCGAAADAEPRVEWEGHRVLVVTDGARRKALVGLALSIEPGERALSVRDASGVARPIPLRVLPKRYREQKLTVPQRQVDLSPEDAARVEKEQQQPASSTIPTAMRRPPLSRCARR